jgi:hypothetical protein
MRPVAVLNGVLFASVAAIALCLACTALVFALLATDSPRLEAEIRPLLETTGLFLAASVACGAAFYGQLRDRAWRWWAQLAAVGALAAVTWYFIPA